jgi:hypothetical protein
MILSRQAIGAEQARSEFRANAMKDLTDGTKLKTPMLNL